LGLLMSVRVLVADAHEVVRVGIAEVFAGTEIEVIGNAATAAEAVLLATERKPDVVLLDVRLNGETGLLALEEIREKSASSYVLILSAYDSLTYVARAAALGAADYLLKTLSSRELVDAVRAAAQGESPTQFGIMRPIAKAMSAKGKMRDAHPLTRREIQVLRHIGLGLSNKEIARSLEISVETVKEHIQNIFRKIKASDRTQAAVWALRHELV